jgi:hypothetical protein
MGKNGPTEWCRLHSDREVGLLCLFGLRQPQIAQQQSLTSD